MSSKDLDKNQDQNPEDEIYELQSSSQEFIHSVETGVTEDKLNLKKLVFWTVLGISIVIVIIITAYNIFNYNQFEISKQVQDQSTDYDITQLRVKDDKILNTYGIVDKEKGIYHIPIDSAMAIYVRENQQNSK